MSDTYTCQKGHTQQIVFDETYKPRCVVCRNASRRKFVERDARRKVDGMEEEYGPIPPRDPDLVDWVVLWRTAKEGKTPRTLTRAEGKIAREIGLYKGSAITLRKPSWTFNRYGDSMREVEILNKGQGGFDVSVIENQVLRILRETVSV